MSFLRTASCKTLVEGAAIVGDLLPSSSPSMDPATLKAQIEVSGLQCVLLELADLCGGFFVMSLLWYLLPKLRHWPIFDLPLGDPPRI